MNPKELRGLQEAYLEVVEGQQLDEADSLAAMQARREKRLAAQRKREGTTASGRDFGHDYSLSADQQKKRREAEFKAGIGTKKEEVSVYDIILSHLLDEGYADTVESAEGIMLNMSEEWRDSIMEISDRKVKAVRNAREKQWNKQFGKNRVQDPTDDMTDKIDKLIDQRNKRTGSKVKKTTMGQLGDKLRDRGR